jgi:nitroreductase
MLMKELIRKTRSYRRFKQTPIQEEILHELVDLGRLSPNHVNKQPLKYIISCNPETNNKIFPCLLWAKNLKNWSGPKEHERPAAYIIILGDTAICEDFGQNAGIAAQSMVLGATEKGVASCMIGNILREQLITGCAIPQRYKVLLVVALGYPGETILLEDLKDGNTAYYRDENDVHHVPKRTLEEVIVRL